MNSTTPDPDAVGINTVQPTVQHTIVSNSMQFHPGQVLATPGALALMQEHGFEPLQLLTRFVHSDWGDCPNDDAALNEQALLDGSRLMGVYRLAEQSVLESMSRKERMRLPTIWLISDATASEKDDPRVRNVTTFLCPSEY
ncbi:type I restriction endonuclease subunit M [Variovorax sp. PCZ-1]|uniref:type I restriction endonuclease subunit M n=1 Tax=Variovorax sp. PCZ-1 TaxID=2835533 RepID=UPI001BCCDEA4|nr:type I restriction endonuclease subunit M [Variovorax sp. PCZ-1]MBS7809230.1 type I restriction endonuclease subunit M [Variovorax sp. PCZ-1]